MRAAFVAVMAGKQVAVLVPTTVLAQQHFETFRARFEGYPVRVEMLSRFRSAAENKAIVARPRRRHASTSSSARTACCRRTCSSASLGLLVVDEEHRFGVKRQGAHQGAAGDWSTC